MMTGKEDKGNQRFFSKAALLVTILPLWALWAYAYSTLETLESEVKALPQFYGMYLYRESVRAGLEEAARRVSLLPDPEGWTEAGTFLGPEEALVVVDRQGLHILHPTGPPYGSADFLADPWARTAFLRTLEGMEAKGAREGYFSVHSRDTLGESNPRRWFLMMAPAGEDLLCILSVPEERGRRYGEVLARAQENLLRERQRRFVLWTLPVLVLSSVLVGILYRRYMNVYRGRDT